MADELRNRLLLMRRRLRRILRYRQHFGETRRRVSKEECKSVHRLKKKLLMLALAMQHRLVMLKE